MSRATTTRDPRPKAVLGHVPALDGLRGAAVVAVVLFHAGHLRGGFLGVDLFFVLSGFLITRLLVAEHQETGRVSLARFYGRRIRRLAPAVLALVALVALFGSTLFGEEPASELRSAGLATLANIANWQSIWSGEDYWAALRGPGPLEHTWSLSIEEQVYLIWPLTLVLALRLRKGRDQRSVAATIALVGMVASLGSLVYLISAGATPARLYYGTDTRIFAVLVGALVGALTLSERGRRTLRKPFVQGAGFGSALVVAFSWFVVAGDNVYLHRGILLGLGLLCGLMVGVVAVNESGPLVHLLRAPALRTLGLLSYSLYLWHWPVFVALDSDRTGRSGWSLTLVRVGVSLLLSIVSFVVVERPFRLRLPTSVSIGGISALAGVSLVALLFMVDPTTTEDELAFGDSVVEGIEVDATLVIANPVAGTPRAVPRPRPAVADATEIREVLVPAPKPRLLVLGDSQATRLAHPVIGDRRTPFHVALASFVGCGIGPGFPTTGGKPVIADWDGVSCGTVIPTWLGAIRDFDPDVVLVHVGAWEVLDRRLGIDDVAFGSQEWDAATLQQLRDTTETLGAGGAKVIWMAAPCFDATGYEGGPRERNDPARSARWNELLRLVAEERGIDVIGYDAYTCDGPASDNEVGGVEFRDDGVHVTEAAIPTVWAWLASQDALANLD